MGCDIHLVLEQKVNGRWECLDNFRPMTTTTWDDNGKRVQRYVYRAATERNYARFAALAGVRGEGPEPQGWPEDVSGLAQLRQNAYGVDGHSHSWAMLEVALLVFEGTMGKVPPDFNAASYFFDLEEDEIEAAGGIQNFRLLFFFDN